MVTLMILFFIVVYIVLAVLFVKLIKKFTKRKLYKWLAVAFVILLPTWDVVLGTVVYVTACRFIPKVAIYETAETDGIYYEGVHDYVYKLERNRQYEQDEELIRIGWIYYIFPRGFKFAESLVTKEIASSTKKKKIKPVIYRCIPLPKDWSRPSFHRTNCSVIEKPQSGYLVKVNTLKFGTAEIRYKNVINRSTGKLMAECNLVKLWSCFPFFSWLEWEWWSKEEGSLNKPSFDKYEYFEFNVLKTNNKRTAE